jgi:hypothetical protein
MRTRAHIMDLTYGQRNDTYNIDTKALGVGAEFGLAGFGNGSLRVARSSQTAGSRSTSQNPPILVNMERPAADSQ